MEAMQGQVTQIRTKEFVMAEIIETINHVNNTALAGAIVIGRDLKELKNLVPHGGWLKYIEKHLNYNEKKVQQLIQLSEHYGDENSSFFNVISNPKLTSDLGITKALKLLAIPENEVENFVENNDVNDMTVKQLEEEIKALKEENKKIEAAKQEIIEQHEKEIDDLKAEILETNDNYADINAQIEKLNKEIEEAREENEKLQNEDHEDNSVALEELKKELDEKLKELDSMTEQKDKYEQKIAELEEKQKNSEQNKQAEIDAAVDKAQEQARKEANEEFKSIIDAANAEKDSALEQAELAEKKLSNASNEGMLKFKIKFDDFQNLFNELAEYIQSIVEEEKANKLKGAVKGVIRDMDKQLTIEEQP